MIIRENGWAHRARVRAREGKWKWDGGRIGRWRGGKRKGIDWERKRNTEGEGGRGPQRDECSREREYLEKGRDGENWEHGKIEEKGEREIGRKERRKWEREWEQVSER